MDALVTQFSGLPTETMVALMAIVLLAFLIESALGFGATVIMVTLGAHVVGLERLLPAAVPLNLVLSAWVAAVHHRSVERAYLGREILPWVALGMVVGMGLWRFGRPGVLLVGFALFVVVLSVLELRRALLENTPVPGGNPARPQGGASGRRAKAMLLAGGAVHGMFGSGGPLLVYVMGRSLVEKGAFRATLSALWVCLNLALLAGYAVDGALGWDSFALSLALAPALGAGMVLGEHLHHRLPAAVFRKLVWTVLLLASITLLGRQLAGLWTAG